MLSLRQRQWSNRAPGPDYLAGFVKESEGRLPAPVEAQLTTLSSVLVHQNEASRFHGRSGNSSLRRDHSRPHLRVHCGRRR